MAASFKPAYLIHGDDHGRLTERRAALRSLAERESGAAGFELFEGEAATPDAVAGALQSMTFAIGRRFVVVDGVERWTDKDVEAHIAPALAGLDPDTTVTFFAREEGRAKAPAALHAAVKKAGGQIAAEQAVKPWELAKWAREQAGTLQLDLDNAAAAALVAHVGERPQRLRRELEKLALECEPGARIGADEVDERAADSAERRVWSIADAVVGGDAPEAVRAYLALRAQGEGLGSLLYWMAQRLRLAHEVVSRIESGESTAEVKKGLRMPPRAANQFVAAAGRADRDSLRAAIEALADLEVDTRGGRELAEDTAALRAIDLIAG
jgi:DNA polymerase III subunit delta